MRKDVTKFVVLLTLIIGWLAVPPRALMAHTAQKRETDNSILLRIGSASWTYSHKQLVAMATDAISNMKETRKKAAVPLTAILFKDTKMVPERVHMVFVIGDSLTTVLRGNDLAYLNKLVLATGPDKGGKPHQWALTTQDEEAYKALRPHMGARRKHGVYRIDIVLKGDVAKSS